MTNFEEAIAALDAALWVEDLTTARSLWEALQPADASEQWRKDIRRAYLVTPVDWESPWYTPVDEIELETSRLCESPDANALDVERSLISSLGIDVARRRKDAAFARIDAIEARCGSTARVIAARARLHLAFDQPQLARDVLDAAELTISDYHLDNAYAELLYAVADFDGAAQRARRLESTAYALEGLDLLVKIAGSQARLDAELQAITAGIELAPGSDNLAARLAHRAQVYASLDQLDLAEADLKQALAVAPSQYQDAIAIYVRHRLDALATAGPHSKHRRLEAFPSVVQKWNYCGPAVIELCLRYTGIEMTQDIIAEAVKEEEGTPMLAIIEFLRRQGIETRRVEASPERIKAAIDLGVPIIIEDDYSNNNHVTVAIGYDERLGMLIVADPATHAPRFQGVESRNDVAKVHRYGGVAVLGRSADVTPDLREALDAAGLGESTHIAIMDQTSRSHDGPYPFLNSVTHLEAGGLARAALALEPDFARAALVEMYSKAGMEGSESDLVRALGTARERFPEVSEFAEIAGQLNSHLGNRAMAMSELVHAARLDGAKSMPRVALALELAELRKRALAYRYANDALVRDPNSPAPTYALARVLVDEVVARRIADRTLLRAAPAFSKAKPETASEALSLDDDALLQLAATVTAAAVDMDATSAHATLAAADLAFAGGELTEAQELYETAIGLYPEWNLPQLRLAYCQEARDLGELAAHTTRELTAVSQHDPWIWQAILELLARVGAVEDVHTAAERAIGAGVDANVIAKHTFAGYRRALKSHHTAGKMLAELVLQHPSRDDLSDAAVYVLRTSSLEAVALEVLDAVIASDPGHAPANYMASFITAPDPDMRGEALEYAERAYNSAPWAEAALTQYGWLLLEYEPTKVLSLARSFEPKSINVLELEREALMALGKKDEAREVRQRLYGGGGGADNVELEIASSHLNARRFHKIMATDLPDAPPLEQRDQVASWMGVQLASDHADRIAKLINANPELLEHQAIARIAHYVGMGVDASIVARAANIVADAESDPAEAAKLRLKARVASGDADALTSLEPREALEAIFLADTAAPVAVKLHHLTIASQECPDDPDLMAALASVLLDNGQAQEAIALADKMVELYPYDHHGFERQAEAHALSGDLDKALEAGRMALGILPHCPRAMGALAVVHALRDEWDAASQLALASLARNTDPELQVAGSCEALVSAAAQGDMAAYEAAKAAAATLTPQAPRTRLEQACERKLGLAV